MALDMTAEERKLGQDNFKQVSQDLDRRGFLKALGGSFGAAGVGAAAYFGYEAFAGAPLKAALIGCGDEGGVLAGELDTDFIRIVAVNDIRPYNQDRIFEGQGRTHIRKGLKVKYGEDAREEIKMYTGDYKTLLRDVADGTLDIDMVIIALPLHLHAPAAIDFMKAGKERHDGNRPLHVFCEKLMARTVGQCKEMIRTARDTGSLLAVGHQRHYSLLYAHALEVMNSGVLGEVRHIRALWHRNNSWPYESKPGEVDYDALNLRRPYYRDGWFHPIYTKDYEALNGTGLLEEAGYDSIDQLVRWRLYDRTGGGLMAELGSHQLDACSIFLGKVKPLAVNGVGYKSFYEPGKNDRSCDDHVFTTFEFPGENYYNEFRNPASGVKDPNDVVVVTYSSVNTNGFENYGECVMGSRGTMIVEAEQAVMLYAEQKPGTPNRPRSTNVTVSTVGADQATLDAAASGYAPPTSSGAPSTAGSGGPVSRGYTEELAHFAYCVKLIQDSGGRATYEKNSEGNWVQEMPRCDGELAMADAILALTSNIAMDTNKRIEFRPEWFAFDSDEVPDGHVKPDQMKEHFAV